MAKKTVKIKLVKSIYGHKPEQVKTLRALGFTKIGQVIKKTDNDAIRGMIKSVQHLIEIEK